MQLYRMILWVICMKHRSLYIVYDSGSSFIYRKGVGLDPESSINENCSMDYYVVSMQLAFSLSGSFFVCIIHLRTSTE